MKKLSVILTLLIGFFCLFALSTSAMADNVKAGDIITLNYGSAHSGNGGEFLITSSSYSFETFCLETDEFFTPGKSYKVAGVTDSAQRGGSNTNLGDILDNKTAWLYYMFRTNQLDDYNNDSASAGALQNAIWYIEEEITSISGQALIWYNAADQAVTAYNWSNNGQVAVVNIVDTNYGVGTTNYYKQDQLTLVPEPTSLILLGLGLLGIAVLRRKQ